jgi:hypothetical protein
LGARCKYLHVSSAHGSNRATVPRGVSSQRTPANSRREERDVSTRNPTTPDGWNVLSKDAASIRHHRQTPLQDQRASARIRGAIADRATEIVGTISEPPQAGPKGEAHDGPSNWRASVHLSRDGGDKGKGRAPPLHLSRHNRRQIAAVTENLAKKQQFACSAKCARRGALHLSRFRLNSLIYLTQKTSRAGRRAGPRALHLSRPSVARLPSARCISPGQALHLSAEVPFFSIETKTFKPLL